MPDIDAHVATKPLLDDDLTVARALPFLWQYAPVGMVVCSLDGRIHQANPAFCEMVGYDALTLCGMSWRELTHPEDIEVNEQGDQRLLTGELAVFEVAKRYVHREGHTVHARLQVTVARNEADETTGLIGVVQDVTEHIEARTQLARAANYDPLTGLPNRRAFVDTLRKVVTEHPDLESAVLFIDLDHFKTVNDCVGHHLGDRVLQLLGERIRGCLDDGYLLARYGGDEFTVLIAGEGSVASARAVASCIHRRLRTALTIGGHDVFCSVSIGLAMASLSDHDAGAVMRDADIALYRAKDQGRSCTVEFTGSMRTEVLERHALRTDLHLAIDRDELRLYYQPIVDLSQLKVVGHEALMRWRHPGRGLVPPDLFLPIAEQHGLTPRMGRWTVSTACQDLARMGDGPGAPYVSINMSMRQLADPGLLAYVDDELLKWDLDPTRLRVEVTEQVVAEDLGQVVRVLEGLRARGVGVYVDDFGTGVSSYARLHQLPLDALKIDKAFVWSMVESEGLALVRSILGLSSSLGLPTIAEGVETEQQRDLLQSMGCNQAQGWLFGRPVPLN